VPDSKSLIPISGLFPYATSFCRVLVPTMSYEMDTGCSYAGDVGNQCMEITYINIDVSVLPLHLHVVGSRYK
jgi:hypothetical protein